MIKCENECPLKKFGGCCCECPNREDCEEVCEEEPTTCGQAIFDEESGLQEFKNTQLAALNAVASLTAQKKAIEEQEKKMKAVLYDAMEKYGVKKFESDILNLTFVAPTTANSVDSAKLKKKYPDIFTECSKSSAKAGYVKITLKGDKE
jgi:hypothetical protein